MARTLDSRESWENPAQRRPREGRASHRLLSKLAAMKGSSLLLLVLELFLHTGSSPWSGMALCTCRPPLLCSHSPFWPLSKGLSWSTRFLNYWRRGHGGGVVGSSLIRVEAGPLTVGKVPDLVLVRYFHLQASLRLMSVLQRLTRSQSEGIATSH